MVIVTKCWQSAVLQYLCLRIIQEAKSQLRLRTGLYTRLYLRPMHWVFHCQCQCQVSTRSLQVWLGLVWQWQVDRIIQVVDIKQSYVCSVQIIFCWNIFLASTNIFEALIFSWMNIFWLEFLDWVLLRLEFPLFFWMLKILWFIMKNLLELVTLILAAVNHVESIKCYQCASTEDQQKPTGIWSKDKFSQDRFEDRCGVYWPFQKERNTAVECNSDESHTPGTIDTMIGINMGGQHHELRERTCH